MMRQRKGGEPLPLNSPLLNLDQVAHWFGTSPNSIRLKISRGQLGAEDGLRYLGTKPYFFGDVLYQRMRSGELSHPKRSVAKSLERMYQGKAGRMKPSGKLK